MAGQLPLTERLQRAFAARVSDLPDDTQLLVLIAALIGGEDVIAGRGFGDFSRRGSHQGLSCIR